MLASDAILWHQHSFRRFTAQDTLSRLSLCDAMRDTADCPLGEVCWDQVVYKNTFLEVVDEDAEAVKVKFGRSASWPCLGAQVSEPTGAIIQAEDQKEAEDSSSQSTAASIVQVQQKEAEDSSTDSTAASAESPVESPRRKQDAILNQSRMDPGKEPCLFYISSSGCRGGAGCQFAHNKHPTKKEAMIGRPRKQLRDKQKTQVASFFSGTFEEAEENQETLQAMAYAT
eukprot:s2635_g1.t2